MEKAPTAAVIIQPRFQVILHHVSWGSLRQIFLPEHKQPPSQELSLLPGMSKPHLSSTKPINQGEEKTQHCSGPKENSVRGNQLSPDKR